MTKITSLNQLKNYQDEIIEKKRDEITTQSSVGWGSDKFAPQALKEDQELDAPRGKEIRVVLRNCTLIDPESLDDYISQDGYQALATVLEQNSPEQVIETIRESGLRGRGGAGFPTAKKWELTRNNPGNPKYIICNADEGDPGAFMNRRVLEGDPHSVLEGMAIAAYAIGAEQG